MFSLVPRCQGLFGCGGPRRKARTTVHSHTERTPPAPDLVKRDFAPEAPDRLWVADITYVRTWEGRLYLSFVLDTYSRRIVGWSMANNLRTELVLDAVNMAICTRRPDDPLGDPVLQGESSRKLPKNSGYLFLSTVHTHSAGVGSAVPSPSSDLTSKTCLPSERRFMFSGEEHS